MLFRRLTALPIVISLTFLSLGTKAQEASGPRHQIQAVVDGLENGYQARLAAQILQADRAVLMAQFDPVSRNMLLHVLPADPTDEESINAMLAELGLSVRCLTRKPVDDEPFQHLDPIHCQGSAGPNE